MSDSKERDLKLSRSVRSKSTPDQSSKNTGLTYPSTATSNNSPQHNSEQMELFPNSFAVASPVSPSASLVVKEANKTKDTSGQRCLDLYESANLDGSLARMLLDSLNLVSTRYSLHWKLKATPLGRLLFQRSRSMRRTKETGSGLLHTPTAKGNQMAPSMNSGWLWGTPAAADSKGSTGGGMGKSLRTDVRNHPGKLFPTPTTQEAEHRNMVLNEKGRRISKDGKNTHSLSLADVAQIYPTPAHRDFKGMSGKGRQERKGNPKDTLPNAVGGSLNPQFVEWLMGFAIDHTELKDWVMPSSPRSQK